MAWIESHQALSTHPKVLDLSARMNWTLDETLGKLHRFWWWCVDYAPDGDLRRYNDTILAGSVGLAPDRAESFVQAMVASCWIDREPYFRVHDWWDYVGRFLQVKYKQNPAKWQEVQASYHNPPMNGSKTTPRNRSKTQDQPTSYQPTLTNQPEEGAVRMAKPRAAPTRGCVYPEEFKPDSRAESLATGYGLNVSKLHAAFSDHHRANGSIFKDWQAAFRNWIRNEVKFSQRRPHAL